MEGKGENGLVEASGDCDDERAKLRPADIDADVREMERRKRVEAMMSSRLFREELERIVEAQMKDGAAAVGPLLQQIQDMMQTGPARSHNSFSVKSTNCVIPINDIRGVESMGYAKGEKILRCKLAAVYRLMDLYGWTQGIANHITGRLNQEEELLLVNAYGMLYHEVTASSLVKVDMQGNIVEPGTTNYGVNVQGFHLHAAIHQARPDIKCIIHVHTPSVLAVSSLKAGLLPLSNESVVIGEVSCHQSTGSIQEPEEKDKLARNLGPVNKVMLLSNNGAVCCGETVEEAFFNVYNTVLACESQMKVMPLGVDNLVLMQDETRKSIYDSAHRVPESTALPSTTGQPSENKEKRWRIGGLHFEALMRMLDNAGFRTGYIYRTPLIKGEPPKPRSDVEVPPAVSSLGYLLEEEEMYRNWKKMGGTKNDRTRWLNSPNVYQKVEILETGTPDPKKITKWVDANAEEWVADGSPTHSSTPVKISDALQFVPKNTNPKEFKKLQQQIKENRRADKITCGPQSHILEGVTWEEAKKLQDANLSAGDQVVLVGAASKGIIQREFQHNATVYKTPYAKNPFDSISAQEIEEYKRTVTRKQRGESYDDEVSESEALSSSAALPPSGLKSPPSETDDDSRTEPRVLRIETKTAPIPSQAEYVLSDDDVFLSSPEQTRKTLVTVKVDNRDKDKHASPYTILKDGPCERGTERIKCYTRVGLSPSPACKERPTLFKVSSDKKFWLPADKFQGLENVTPCRSSFDTGLFDGSSSSIKDEKCTWRDEVAPPSHLKKPPVARKLAMDYVIDQLKYKSGILNKKVESDLNNEDGELLVTLHVNSTKRALLVRNNYQLGTFLSDWDKPTCNGSSIVSGSSTGCNDLQVCNNCSSQGNDSNSFGVDFSLRSKSLPDRRGETADEYPLNSWQLGGTELPSHLSQVDKRILLLDSDHFDKGRDLGFKLTVDGKDLYQFYKDFDPDEVFQADPDDVSTKAHYDNHSVVEHNLDLDLFTGISEDKNLHLESNCAITFVDENIFTGKKYMMKRYLCGDETPDNLQQDSFVDLDSQNNKLSEICCGISEDSAVFSELTVKTNVGLKGNLDPDKVIEWSLSENSKGGFSVDSSESSGVRMSTSEDDVPSRQTISSLDDFLIKETICNIYPDFDKDSLCNSRLSHPLSLVRSCSDFPLPLKKTKSLPNISLGSGGFSFNVKQMLNCNSYSMPDKSTVCSYYTLVSVIDRFSSLPDLSRSAENSDKYKSSCTDSMSDTTFKQETDCEFDNCDVYISDDYICLESDSCCSDRSEGLYSVELGTCVTGDVESNLMFTHVVENPSPSNRGPTLTSKTANYISNTSKNSPGIKVLEDCLQCFAASMEESIYRLLPDEKKQNKIITSLKKKFSKHNCRALHFLKHPLKSNLYYKSKKLCFNGRHNSEVTTPPTLCSCFNNPFQHRPIEMKEEQFNIRQTETDDHFVQLENSSGVKSELHVVCIDGEDDNRGIDTELSLEASSKQDILISACSEFIPTGSVSSKLETVYSTSTYESIYNEDTTDESNCQDTSKITANFSVSSTGSRSSDLDTAFIMEEEESEDNLNTESFVTYMNSVSCQTDEYFEDDYRPEDYTDNPMQFEAHSNYQLYTIFETSSELGVEY